VLRTIFLFFPTIFQCVSAKLALIGFVFSQPERAKTSTTPYILDIYIHFPLYKLALFFQIAFQPLSDFELRASDFRPKAGFGFVFSTPSAGLGANTVWL